MSDDAGLLIGVGVFAVVGLFLLARPKKTIIPGVAGNGYLPSKQSAMVAGIGAIGQVLSHGIDAFISYDSNQTKLAAGQSDSTDSDAGAQFAADEQSVGFFDAMALH